ARRAAAGGAARRAARTPGTSGAAATDGTASNMAWQFGEGGWWTTGSVGTPRPCRAPAGLRKPGGGAPGGGVPVVTAGDGWQHARHRYAETGSVLVDEGPGPSAAAVFDARWCEFE